MSCQAGLRKACFAKKHKKKLIDMSGVETNELNWMFFSFVPGPDGARNTLERSDQIVASSPEWRAVISGVLKDMCSRGQTAHRSPFGTTSGCIVEPYCVDIRRPQKSSLRYSRCRGSCSSQTAARSYAERTATRRQRPRLYHSQVFVALFSS
ncbi:hypothetical protein K466DRAFT_589856 [Polyporus arcularius HHB13444]|uniref:Uncharacterized protein n=1 Tax=Polyporus arcularius HHB13444 TaxID=1314778 RepID=A0A5C3P4R0_9APHY|nr:hypothetical protein K466DRAFT_589856 [Polyporus arcularius HHB13444]